MVHFYSTDSSSFTTGNSLMTNGNGHTMNSFNTFPSSGNNVPYQQQASQSQYSNYPNPIGTPRAVGSAAVGSSHQYQYQQHMTPAHPSSFMTAPASVPKPLVAPKVGNATFFPNGRVQNLPGSMITDQFGMAGLMIGNNMIQHGFGLYTRGEEIITGEKEVSYQKGNYDEALYEKTLGPCLNREPELLADQTFKVLPEYLVTHRMLLDNSVSMESLRQSWSMRLDMLNEDLLFFIFYTFVCDALQLVAAKNLYVKGWRYHMEAKVWLQRINGVPVPECGACEKGVYKYFDYVNWKVMQREMFVELHKLEGPPNFPQDHFQQQFDNREAA